MQYVRYLIPILAALLCSLALTPVAIKLAHKWGVVDMPNERKVHNSAMPRMGGLAIYGGFMAGMLLLGRFDRQTLSLIASATIVMGIGLYDDMHGISPKLKLLGQVLASLVLVQSGVVVQFLTNPFNGGVMSLGFFAYPLTIVWLVGISNAINLVDGLDGLSAGISAISALTISVICYIRGDGLTCVIAAIVAAAALGFLRFNFHPAKTFMGDCGSLFLGFLLGALSVMGFSKGATLISIFCPFLIVGIPICDTFFAIIRRSVQKKPIFQADKGHLHHCLLSCGLSHSQTVLVIYAISLLMSVAAVLMAVLTTSQAVLIFIITLVLVLYGAKKIGVLRGKAAPARVSESSVKR